MLVMTERAAEPWMAKEDTLALMLLSQSHKTKERKKRKPLTGLRRIRRCAVLTMPYSCTRRVERRSPRIRSEVEGRSLVCSE